MGADVRYFSKYYAPDYSPVIGQFYNQNPDDKIEIGAFPIVNVYANLHLKRYPLLYYDVSRQCRFGKIQLLPGASLPNQSANDKFGLSWNFFD